MIYPLLQLGELVQKYSFILFVYRNYRDSMIWPIEIIGCHLVQIEICDPDWRGIEVSHDVAGSRGGFRNSQMGVLVGNLVLYIFSHLKFPTLVTGCMAQDSLE